jgi:hypothetical protein
MTSSTCIQIHYNRSKVWGMLLSLFQKHPYKSRGSRSDKGQPKGAIAGGQWLISWLHPFLNYSTKLVHAALMDHTGHIQIGPGVIYIPLKGPDILINPTPRPYVQCRRHIPCRVPHLDPHAPCVICSHTDPYLKTSPLSARPHVLCQRHMPCHVSHPDPHAPCAICPYSDPYVQLRESALIPLITPHPSKLRTPGLPRALKYIYIPSHGKQGICCVAWDPT